MAPGLWLRRSAQILLAALLTTLALVVVTPAADACACGGAVSAPGMSMTVSGETALVTRHGDRETIVMSLHARSEATRAGLLVPTPKPAKASLADKKLFTDLEQQTLPRERTRHHFFGPPALFGTDDPAGGVNYSGDRGPSSVRVLDRVDLGPLEAVTLTAGNADDLHTWLRKHGFVMSHEFESLVTPYLDKGWAFTAMSLTAEGKALSGDLPPVSLSFTSDRLVYPMRMSRGAKEDQTVKTFVLADHRVRRTDPSASQGSLETSYAARIRPALVSSPDLKRLARGNQWLTVLDQSFDDPATQVRSDFTFAPAADDTPVIEYRYVDDYVIPIDVAILLALTLAGLVGGVVVVVRHQRRS
ncbi:DUF2330 domain-containing protein [Flexivirga sp. B27]